MMAQNTTIYPYELYYLLEDLAGTQFTGTLNLESEGGQTVLYVNEGIVRYARTTQLLGTFATYLLTERVFTKKRLKGYLKLCTDEGLTLEKYLVRNNEMAAEDLRHLKRDLANSIFSRSFCSSASVELLATTRRTPEYRLSPMNPFGALFKCVAEHPARNAITEALAKFDGQKLHRGPEFFALFPLFRDSFGRSQLFSLLDNEPTIDELNKKIGDTFGVAKEVFAMHLSGMAYFDSEEPQRSPLRKLLSAAESKQRGGGKGRRTRTRTRRQAAPASEPEAAGSEAQGFRKETTRPGVGAATAQAETDGSAQATAPASGPHPAASEGTGGSQSRASTADFTSRRESTVPGLGRRSSGEDVSLGEAMIGERLVERSATATAQDFYAFLGVPPDAQFSQIRAAYMRSWAVHASERFDAEALTPEALGALQTIQDRIELAYETLTDFEARWAHNVEIGLDAQVSEATLQALFQAEALFVEAQEKMNAEAYSEAVDLLKAAAETNPREPEYLSYLAWAVACANMYEQPTDEGFDVVDVYLERAFRLDPNLESAWLFRARLAELSEDLPGALACYVAVLEQHPDSEEAMEAVARLRDMGVSPA